MLQVHNEKRIFQKIFEYFKSLIKICNKTQKNQKLIGLVTTVLKSSSRGRCDALLV